MSMNLWEDPKILVEVATAMGTVEVSLHIFIDGTRKYNVSVNGEIKHNQGSAEDAIRALGHYLAATHPQG